MMRNTSAHPAHIVCKLGSFLLLLVLALVRFCLPVRATP
jgi:hypothetical protein